jgi:hypothetical protein
MFKLLALCRGWREAHDADDGTLVVWHDVLGIHYTGSDAWKLAALHPWR